MNSRRKATDEEILADLRRVADERDSGQLTMRDYDDADGLVSADTVKRRFESWPAALDKIGLKPGSRRNVSDEEILADLRRVADDLGSERLMIQDYNDADGLVSAGTVIRRFGSWPAALDEIGLETGRRDLRRVADELDTERLSETDYTDSDGIVSIQTVKNHFGPWTAALDEAGLKPGGRQNVPDEEILADLRRVADKFDTERLTTDKYDEADGLVSAQTVIRRFGSWTAALDEVSLKPGKKGGSTRNATRNVSDEEILADLRRVAGELDTERLSKRDYDDADGIVSSGIVHQRLGSWTSAVEKAGLKPGESPGTQDATNEEILADLRRVADELDSGQLTMRDYDDADGIVTAGTVHQRFGTWTAALDEIDLEPEGDDE